MPVADGGLPFPGGQSGLRHPYRDPPGSGPGRTLRESLPLLESGRPIDLLLSDVGLPGMNGRQLAEIARQRRPRLKVLFTTGYAEGGHLEGYPDPGMTLITKPFNLDALAARVGETLTTVSSALAGSPDVDK